MEDDFIYSEGETPNSSRRNLLLAGVALLATIILCLLCGIGLLVVEKQEELLASIGAQPPFHSGTPTAQDIVISPSSSPSATALTESVIVQQTATAEIPRGALRIITYTARRVPFRVISTATPRGPHRIIRYDNSVSGEGRD